MLKVQLYSLFLSLLVLLTVVLSAYALAQVEQGGPPAPPPARKIPGITAEDMFPRGCVDCHINRPDMNMDTRLGTHMKQWMEKVDPEFLARVQQFAPKGITLKGKHPAAIASIKDIPAACLKCHSKVSKLAPPFSRMLHGLHLAGGTDSPFLTFFQGECTYCHKLNLKTGAWSNPSGPEK